MIELFLDLETIPVRDSADIDYLISKIKPHHACKSEESKQKSINGQKADVIAKTSFDGTYGSVCTIGFAIDDNKTRSLQRCVEVDENYILQSFFDNICNVAEDENKTAKQLSIKWIAHNKDFDLRFLFQRCVINNIDTYGIKIPVNDRHGTNNVFCTMQAWRGFGAKAGGSLDAICRALKVKGKGGMTGADVWPEYHKGNYDKIAEYCRDDVRALRDIYRRMTKVS